MTRYLKTALILAAICAVSAVILAALNMVTKPAIDAYEEGKTTSALKAVSNGMEIGEYAEINDGYITYRYELTPPNATANTGANTAVTGYILGLKTNGYGGEMVLVASFDTDGVVMNAVLVSDDETPGVGKKAEADGYMDKFIGTGSTDNPVPTTKSMLSEVDSAAVSGATMTFTGITKALNAGSAYVRSLAAGGQK